MVFKMVIKASRKSSEKEKGNIIEAVGDKTAMQ